MSNGFSDFKPVRKEEFDPQTGVPIEPEVSPIIQPDTEQRAMSSEPTAMGIEHGAMSDDPIAQSPQPPPKADQPMADTAHSLMPEAQSTEPITHNPELETQNVQSQESSVESQTPSVQRTANSELPPMQIINPEESPKPQAVSNEPQVVNAEPITQNPEPPPKADQPMADTTHNSKPRRPRRGCNPFSVINGCNIMSCGCGSFLAVFLVIAVFLGIYFSVPAFLGNTLDALFNPEIPLPTIQEESTEKIENTLQNVPIKTSKTLNINENKFNILLKQHYQDRYLDARVSFYNDECNLFIKPEDATPWITISMTNASEGQIVDEHIFIGPVETDDIMLPLLEDDMLQDGTFDATTFFESVLFAQNPRQIQIDKIYFAEDNLVVITKAVK